MATLTDEDIEEFRKIYKEEYGEEISADDARHMGSQLIELCMQLIQPLPSERTEAAAKKPDGEESPSV